MIQIGRFGTQHVVNAPVAKALTGIDDLNRGADALPESGVKCVDVQVGFGQQSLELVVL